MTIPTKSPMTTANEMFSQLSICNTQRIRKVATTIKAELRFVPTDRELSRSFMPASSLVRTENMPKMESRMPTAAISIGAMTALNCMSTSPPAMNAAAPNAEVARMEPQ